MKIGTGGNAQKRNKEKAGIEDGGEGTDDVTSATKKQKTRNPRKKAGGKNLLDFLSRKRRGLVHIPLNRHLDY